MPYVYEYPRMGVTVDVVLFASSAGSRQVLLIQRKNPPFQGAWALPGGHVEMDETAIAAAARELHEETGMVAGALDFIWYFDAVNRSPDGRTLALAFQGEAAEGATPVAGDDAAAVRWFPVGELPDLAFDHAEMIARALA
jgi:8-oxo-dGTP diphosphatase